MGGKNVFIGVYKIVRKIPKGKVATYGQIAKLINSSNSDTHSLGKISPRVVGWALHANKDMHVPCHRVVNKDGRLAKNFAFGGLDEQRKRLLEEKAVFKNKTHVDLKKSLWKKK